MSDVKHWNGSAWVAAAVKTWDGSAWTARQARVWDGGAWVAVPPNLAAPTVFNVMDYGAHRDGVTTDHDHIQLAYNAARAHSAEGAPSVVYFPPGTYFISDNILLGTIRTNDWHTDPDGNDAPTAVNVQQAGTIVFSGYGATIKYENKTARYSWLRMGSWPTELYTTYGNLAVEGFTIDNNWKAASGQCGYICWLTGEGNYDNFTFKDITTTDHIAPRLTDGQYPGAGGIYIHGDDESAGQAHYGYCTNIRIENCSIHAAGKSISILGAKYGSYVENEHYVYDNIHVVGGYMDNHEYYGSNIHLVQAAAGYRVSCVGVDCRDSADDGIEINNCNEVLVEDCHYEGNRQAVCLTWFAYPWKDTVPTTVLRGLTYGGQSGRYWTTDGSSNDLRSPMMPEVRGYMTNTTTANCKGRSYGHFLIEDCDLEIGFVDDYNVARSPFTIGSNSIPMESVTIKDCDVRSDGALGADIIYVRQGAQLGRTLPVTIQNVRHATSIGGALQKITADQVTLVGERDVTSDVDGLS